MSIKAHPLYRAFKAWFVSHMADAFAMDDVVYRAAGPRHTTAKAIVSGVGGLKADGRWCRRGVTRIVYASEEPETALCEANEHARVYGLPQWKTMPKVVIGIQAKLSRVIDLTEPRLAATLPRSLKAVMVEDWRDAAFRHDESASQAIGRAGFAAGIQALRVPSKPDPTGVNVVIFPDHVGRAGKLTLLNPDLLSKLGRGV